MTVDELVELLRDRFGEGVTVLPVLVSSGQGLVACRVCGEGTSVGFVDEVEGWVGLHDWCLEGWGLYERLRPKKNSVRSARRVGAYGRR